MMRELRPRCTQRAEYGRIHEGQGGLRALSIKLAALCPILIGNSDRNEFDASRRRFRAASQTCVCESRPSLSCSRNHTVRDKAVMQFPVGISEKLSRHILSHPKMLPQVF